MMILSSALASLLGLMLGAKIVLLVVGIRRNQRAGDSLRDALRRRLGELPLSEMLARREVEPRVFLNDQRLVDIERQLRTCAGCEESPRCRALVKTGIDGSFCPLEDVMLQLRAAA